MNYAPFRLVINAMLVGVLSAMFILPVAMVHVITQVAETESQVAGASNLAGDFVVLPNFFDFGEHATFEPVQDGNQFSDMLTLTAFQRQVATYHTIYTVLNKNDEPLQIDVLLTDVPEPTEPYDMFLVSFASDEIVHTAIVSEDVAEGALSIPVEDGSVARGVRYVVIDNEVVLVRAVEGNNIIVDPTTKAFEKDMTVYRAGLVVRDGAVVHSNITGGTIDSNRSATINAVVVGKDGVATSSIAAPLFIRVRPSEE